MNNDVQNEVIMKHIVEACRVEDDQLVKRVVEITSSALTTLDVIGPLLHNNDENVITIWQDTRDELLDCAVAVVTRREKMLYVMMRGVMEGLFTSLYYREQGMSRTLWARGQNFVMTHQLFDERHEFYQYFKPLFEDEAYKRRSGGIGAKKIFAEASSLYGILSSYVHKKRVRPRLNSVSTGLVDDFEDVLQKVFRIALTFLDAVEDLPPGLCFPSPLTLPEYVRRIRTGGNNDA